MDETDDLFARPPRRSIPLPPRQTCAVCGLGSSTLVCDMCIEHTASSIVWLEKLPTLSMKEQQALDQLHATQPNRENYFDGEWRPVTDHSFKAMEKLRSRGFELHSDRYGKLMARWPIAPAAPLTSCRSCRIEFEDVNGHKLCDECLIDRVNGAGELELDDPNDVINQSALTFSGIPLDYWREEVRLECAISLVRLKRICKSRDADFDKTIAGLKGD